MAEANKKENFFARTGKRLSRGEVSHGTFYDGTPSRGRQEGDECGSDDDFCVAFHLIPIIFPTAKVGDSYYRKNANV